MQNSVPVHHRFGYGALILIVGQGHRVEEWRERSVQEGALSHVLQRFSSPTVALGVQLDSENVLADAIRLSQ